MKHVTCVDATVDEACERRLQERLTFGTVTTALHGYLNPYWHCAAARTARAARSTWQVKLWNTHDESHGRQRHWNIGGSQVERRRSENRGAVGGEGVESGRGYAPSQKIYEFFVSKWCHMVHSGCVVFKFHVFNCWIKNCTLGALQMKMTATCGIQKFRWRGKIKTLVKILGVATPATPGRWRLWWKHISCWACSISFSFSLFRLQSWSIKSRLFALTLCP